MTLAIPCSARTVPWALWLGLALPGCDGEELTAPAPPPAIVRQISIVSGDGQEGKAGKLLEFPLRVRVTDSEGRGLPGLVSWTLTTGQGRFRWLEYGSFRFSESGAQTPTFPDGIAEIEFLPRRLGPSTVTVSVPGAATVVTFTVRATAVAIIFDGAWGWIAPFAGGIPVGTLVEWDAGYEVNQWAPCTPLRIRSTEAPDGAGFDSGPLADTEGIFQFVPAVAGTWKYDVDYDCDWVDHLTLIAE